MDYNPEYCVVPSEEKINQALEKIDYRLIEIDETAKTVYLPEPGMKLDLGAIAKGFAADKVTEYLIDQGFEFFLISLGGNAYNYGESKINPGKTGTLLTNPFGGKYLIKFLGNSQTIVTSGVYERYIEVGNDIYHHLLNPKTGYPYENNLMSVSIVLNYREGYYASAFADAFATGIYALGLEDGLAYAENRPDMEAVAITKDKKVYATSKLDFQPYIGLTDEFELFVGGEKVDFEPLPTNPTNPENPTDPYDPTRDLLIALIFIVVGFGATVLLVFTLKKPKNKTKRINMSILQIRNLHVSVEGKEILKGINLEIKTGEFHVIMGPNGTGKSTLASTVMGHYKYEVTKGESLWTAKTCWRCRLTKDRAKAYFWPCNTQAKSAG